jgi:hypothetical protein
MYKESRQPVFKPLTPQEADIFLAINDFPGQRKLNPMKAKLYADNMENGTHRRIELAVVRVNDTDKEFLVNGQHNCRAVGMYGKPYPAVISYYIANNMEEAWRLFATFDVHATRTEGQFMHARRGIFKDARLHAVPLRVLTLCGTALVILGDGESPVFFLNHGKCRTIKADAVEAHPDDVLFVAQYAEQQHMIRIGVIAAMIATLRKNREAAKTFWDYVASGDTVHTHPCRKVRDGLLDTRYLHSVTGGSVAQQSAYDFCITWWNAWRTGANRKIVKVRAMMSRPGVAP